MENELLPCPFCGRPPSEDLIDSLYPNGIEWYQRLTGRRGYVGHRQAQTLAKKHNGTWGCVWKMQCCPSEGGCGAEVHGDSREEAIDAWNKRKSPPLPELGGDDEEQALEILLRLGCIWCREAHYTINRGEKYEQSGEGTVLLVNCNDVFLWGCADAEDLPYDEIPNLYRFVRESLTWGSTKWACLKRGLQPQWPIRRDMQKAGVWDDQMEALEKNPTDHMFDESRDGL